MIEIVDNNTESVMIDSNELKEIKYGSAEDNDSLAKFFQASNTDTNVNSGDMNIWDKLRKNSPMLSEVNYYYY